MKRLQIAVELIRLSELIRTYVAVGWALPEPLAQAYHAAGLIWDRDAEAVRHRDQPPVRVPAPRTRFDAPRATVAVGSYR